MRIATLLFAGLVGLGMAIGCGETEKETEKAAAEVERAAETAAANFEKSAESMKETYDEKRAAGEGRVEAAGDAYNEVLQEGGLDEE